MHGFIFVEFEKYVIDQFGYQNWRKVVDKCGIADRGYDSITLYPDKELFSVIHETAAQTDTEVPVLLEKFGYYLVPDLMKVYKAYINPTWRTLDLLEHAESNMHAAVRSSTAGAAPPVLVSERIRPNEIVIQYVSKRNIPELGVGIIKGIAAYYLEEDHVQVVLQKEVEPGKSLISVRYL
ncbi:MAG: heme NO-binding domain-containing protein [Hymenobacteraceae bacterium]|nr:heme NO-binding domain-containing protein [Hymenobacteraceae bacterium]MDX5397527.1 heme NO-binding domain-containing protein [Hymenobacteraceae bacterium]MDX5513605.1 heme NO-binding domain-containing protein [Hymenobacteraceae bacterium]